MQVRREYNPVVFSHKGALEYTGSVYFEGVDRDTGISVQLQANTDVENATLVFTVQEVTNNQDDFVSLNSSGYLTIEPNATSSFFIDVSATLIHIEYICPCTTQNEQLGRRSTQS